jgi:class 3 adenylate cyclase
MEVGMSDVTEASFLIVVTDLERFAAESARRSDLEVADAIHQYYALAATTVEGAGGRVIKFLGDACLAVFPTNAADQAIDALLAFRVECDALTRRLGWQSTVQIRAHAGIVAAGELGVGASRRYDIIGRNVNLTFRLASNGMTLSPEAFQCLGAERRRAFKKHTPPVMYIHVEDPHEP